MSTSLPIRVLLSVAKRLSGAVPPVVTTVSLPSALMASGTSAAAAGSAATLKRSCSGDRLKVLPAVFVADDDGAVAAEAPGSEQAASPSSAETARATTAAGRVVMAMVPPWNGVEDATGCARCSHYPAASAVESKAAKPGDTGSNGSSPEDRGGHIRKLWPSRTRACHASSRKRVLG